MDRADLRIVALDGEEGDRRDLLIKGAAALLNSQWPRSEASASSWLTSLDKSSVRLPLHLVGLIEGIVCSHASLHAATIQGDSRNVVLQSLVVDSSRRGKGLGRRFLSMVEEWASGFPFGYIYLSTTDQQAFYTRCGYKECAPANLDVPVLASRKTALSGLEGLLRKRVEGGEDAAATPIATSSLPHTWFQKRLRAFPAREEAKVVSWEKGYEKFFARELAPLLGGFERSLVAKGFCSDLVWLRQIGPSCGLTALVMIADTIANNKGEAPAAPLCRRDFTLRGDGEMALADFSPYTPLPLQSIDLRGCLLKEAIHRKITTDGEVFSTACLAEAASDLYGLGKRVNLHTGFTSAEQLFSALKTMLRKEPADILVLIAYDADNTNNHKPCFHGGASAHWAIVAGAAWDAMKEEGGDIAAILVHSASYVPVACSLKELAASNFQLMKADARRAKYNSWVIPESGDLDLAGGFITIQMTTETSRD
jgi:predicted N-acetyltransferase YhbS